MFFIQGFLSMSMTLWPFSHMTAELRIWVVRWQEKRGGMGNYVVSLIVQYGLSEINGVNLSRFGFILTFVD